MSRSNGALIEQAPLAELPRFVTALTPNVFCGPDPTIAWTSDLPAATPRFVTALTPNLCYCFYLTPVLERPAATHPVCARAARGTGARRAGHGRPTEETTHHLHPSFGTGRDPPWGRSRLPHGADGISLECSRGGTGHQGTASASGRGTRQNLRPKDTSKIKLCSNEAAGKSIPR